MSLLWPHLNNETGCHGNELNVITRAQECATLIWNLLLQAISCEYA